MPLFVLDCVDRAGAGALRQATRAAHLAWLQGFPERVKAGGAVLDADGAPIGSLLIVEAESAEAVRAWAADDPYARAGLFASTAVRPWRLAVGAVGVGAGPGG